MSTQPLSCAEGTAFPVLLKLASSALVAAVAASGFGVADDVLAAGIGWPAALMLMTAIAMLLLCLWWIWHSRTAVDPSGIRQTWVWNKQVEWTDMAQVRLVSFPGLGWLIAPRLIVRVRGGRVAVFHVADPAVLRVVTHRLAMGLLGEA